MNGKYILISGSSGHSCSAANLQTAVTFVRGFTEEVLRRGGGFVVLAGAESPTMDESGTPRIFGWQILRAVAEYAGRTTENPRTYARIVMSDDATESKIDDANLRLLTALEQRNVIERRYIRRELFTGGAYRQEMTEWADAMVAIGGGKGTYSAGVAMMALCKPVLPLDLQLGSITDDGDGGVGLYREMLSQPCRFFPRTHSAVTNMIEMLSLNRGVNETSNVARSAVELLERELCADQAMNWSARIRRRLVDTWRFAKSLPIVAAGIKVFEFVRSLFLVLR